MLSTQAQMLNQIFKNMPAEDADVVHDYAKEREQNKNRELPEIPKGVTVQLMDFDGIDGEIITPAKPNPDKIIWYIHQIQNVTQNPMAILLWGSFMQNAAKLHTR